MFKKPIVCVTTDIAEVSKALIRLPRFKSSSALAAAQEQRIAKLKMEIKCRNRSFLMLRDFAHIIDSLLLAIKTQMLS
jgi:hypothetical protein